MGSSACLGEEAILAFIEGRAPDLIRNEIDAHLDACTACRAVVLGAGGRSVAGELESLELEARAAPGPIFPEGAMLDGRYRIGPLLGRGGMGDVYVAEDKQLGAKVALKTVNALFADQPHIAVRLKREVLLARRVTHRSVCRVFDFGVHQGVAFLTMELLEGETLGARLRREGPMSTDVALPIVEQLAGALEAAHAAGIIHRDFKSDNVIILEAGGGSTRAVVTDFGLARARSNRFGGPHRLPESCPGPLIGTLSYMAPEQVEGGTVTPATDVYALGVVLFEMVTGRLPFADTSPMKGAMRRLTERPTSPRAIVPGLPPGWEAAIMRCLEREPGRRFQTARAVWEALGWQPQASPRWARMNSVRLASLLALTVFAIGRPLHSDAGKDRGAISASALPAPLVAPDARGPHRSPEAAPAIARDVSKVDASRRRAKRNRPLHPRAREQIADPVRSARSEAAAPPPRAEADELLDPRDDDAIDSFRGPGTR